MATVEIDEVEFKQNKQLRDTVTKLLSDPEAAVMVERALKKIDPNAATPRLDRFNQVNEPLQAVTKKLEELQDSIKKDKEDREKAEKLAEIRNKIEADKLQLRRDGWTEEGIKGVEKLQEERGILDVMDAAAIFEKQHPPQAPVTPSGTGAWNFMDNVQDGEADLKKLIETKGESTALLDKMTREALAEVRGPSRR